MGWLNQSHEKSLFGQLLVKQNLISEEQLTKAIDQQRKTGQRLGDIFAEWNVITQHHVQQALRKQRHLRLAATIATALLAPLETYAVEPLPVAQVTLQAQALESPHGLRTMTEEDLDHVSAQGLSDELANSVTKNMSRRNGVEVLGDVAKLLNPVLGVLEAETTMKDVVYDPTNAAAVINKDGSITLRMPSSIGELSFQNIRVRGSDGPSFGSIFIRGIDLTGTTVTLTLRH
jgi:hypothetical protein